MCRIRRAISQDTIRQLIFNRPSVRARAVKLVETMKPLNDDQLIDLARLRYERMGYWDAAYDLALLLRTKPDAPVGREVRW